jgi:lysyl-tRNA synthetase class 1
MSQIAVAKDVGRTTACDATWSLGERIPLAPLDFSQIDEVARAFAIHVEDNFERLADVMLAYESYEVLQDEVNRTLYLLNNLRENEEYFRLRIGTVVAFLPRNQPLYAFACFVIIPSFMSQEVRFRVPHVMRHFFEQMLAVLAVETFFPNIVVCKQNRSDFLRDCSALRLDQETKESWPVTDAVIFTGTSVHADQLRAIFDKRTLFIANGAGHNPVVVSEGAHLREAVQAVLDLQFYNQGQDCAAPNSILVHSSLFSEFMQLLRDQVFGIPVGSFHDRACRIGPMSNPHDLVRVQDFLIKNRSWLDRTTPGIIRCFDAVLEPTIICKPLKEGGNFTETFAPIIVVQEYQEDGALSDYFESPHYARNAMYISVYGTSRYVDQLAGRTFGGQVLHDGASILRNTHLHAPGVELGTRPYGGSGRGASSLSINGKLVCKPTLPQRDIWECVAKPLSSGATLDTYRRGLERSTTVHRKDIQKLLRLKPAAQQEKRAHFADRIYVDALGIKKGGSRYVQVDANKMFELLPAVNAEYAQQMTYRECERIRALRAALLRQEPFSESELHDYLCELSKEPSAPSQRSRTLQREFFRHVYSLLLGKSEGPRLASFLLALDRTNLCQLLDV